MMGRLRIIAVFALASGVAGCAASAGRYPSLALREFERPKAAVPAAAPEETEVPAPVASARIAAIRADAAKTFGVFNRQQSGVAAWVAQARGAARESDARTRALVALADLASVRSSTHVHLADLDMLAVGSAITFAPTDEINAVRGELLAMVQEQDKVLQDLWAELEP